MFPRIEAPSDNAVVNTVTVGGSSVQVDTGLANRRSVEVHNRASNSAGTFIVVGFSNAVATANGRRLEPSESWAIDLAPNVQVWAIGSGAGLLLDVTEIGQ